MKILALETATVAGSVALYDDIDGLIAEIKTDVKVAHSERLMPSIQWLLNSSGISINDIDAFAVSIGPGSFTGLRIGLSTAKGFSFAAGKPLVPVLTLDAFARTIPYCEFQVCPMLDARRNEVYTALYTWENSRCIKTLPECAIRPDEILKTVISKTVFMGDGAKTYRKIIEDTLGEQAVFAPESKMSPSASSVAEIASEKLKEGIITDPVSLTPFYIRKSEAEIKWKG